LQVGRSEKGAEAKKPATFNLQPSTTIHLARIEVGVAELPKFVENGLSVKVADALKQIGYAHVTLDLQGYRRGSTNEAINISGSQTKTTATALKTKPEALGVS
jgi:PP-loop superfamily ATP-utilizing enzyme